MTFLSLLNSFCVRTHTHTHTQHTQLHTHTPVFTYWWTLKGYLLTVLV